MATLVRVCLIAVGVALIVGSRIVWNIGLRQLARDDEVFAKGIEDVPFATTRGHLKDGHLTEGHTQFDYSITTGIPGLDTKPESDILIVIHGLNNDEPKAENRFALARQSLKVNGYKGTVIGWNWDGWTANDPFGASGYSEAKLNAIANGPKLANFLVDLARTNPNARIRLIGYSMGARIALEALLALDTETVLRQKGNSALRIASVHLLGAAVDNEEIQTDEKYGRAAERCADSIFNYYSPNDSKLGLMFNIKDHDRALGKWDVEHLDRAPANYHSRDVSQELMNTDDRGRPLPNGPRGANHSAYLGIRDDDGIWRNDGVMNVVVKDIARS